MLASATGPEGASEAAQGAKETPKSRRRKAGDDTVLDPLSLNKGAESASPAAKKPRARTPKKVATSPAVEPEPTEKPVAPETAGAAAAAAADTEPKPTKGKNAPGRRGKAAAAAAAGTAEAETAVADDAQQAADGRNSTESAAAAPEAAGAKPKAKRTPKPAVPPGPLYHVGMRPPPCEAAAHRFLSWNVAGMRAMLKKDPKALLNLIEAEKVDVLCLQEHKLQCSHVDAALKDAGLQDWHATWSCSQTKKGYSGTAVLSREKPVSSHMGIGLPDHDDEGRVVTVELPDVWVVNCYVPNAGEGLKRLDYRVGSWDKAFASYIKQLEAKGKPVVLTGDLNCAHREIDIHDPKRNLRSAGFTQEERDSFSAVLLGEVGLVDTFRAQHPEAVGYTYYSYRFNARGTGKGWRLDYFLVSSSLADRVHDSFILKDVLGSDHCPIGLVLKKNDIQ